MRFQRLLWVLGIIPFTIAFLVSCHAEFDPTPTRYLPPSPAVPPPEPISTDLLEGNSQLPPCVDDARFVEDLTVPDASVVSPGQELDKRWSVRNQGSCDWGPDYRLVRLDEGEIQSADQVALYPARSGTLGIWQVVVTAPRDTGEYLASWRAMNPRGEFFGEEVFILIEVAALTVTPSPAPLLSATEEN